MKSISARCISKIILPIIAIFIVDGLNPFLVQGSTVPTITLPKKTIAVFDVTIAKPTGDPVTAGSLDNEFTYTGSAGIATISVEADVTPLKVEGDVAPLIKWTFESIPAGSSLSWGANSWPGEATAGKGKSAVATLTGYPASNSEFGPRTIKMEVIRNGKVLLTKTTPIELFFKRDDTATGHSLPNWIFYWSQAIGSSANIEYQSVNASGAFGVTPAMLYWSYLTAHDKTKIIVYDTAKTEDPGQWNGCATRYGKGTTGIDAFEDTIVHESKHVLQIAQADPVVGSNQASPWRFGWSWNQYGLHNHWAIGTDGKPGQAGIDDDSNGIIDDLIVTGPGELGGVLKLENNGPDVLLSDKNDPASDWPIAFGALPAGCWPGNSAIEQPAYSSEPDDNNRRLDVDWADPGKQHLTPAYND